MLYMYTVRHSSQVSNLDVKFTAPFKTETTHEKSRISSASALFAKIKTILRDKNASFFRIIDRQFPKLQNGQFHTHCINLNGIIHQNENGLI